ncbi:MAG: hypothetical protein AB1483_07310 [Candidatus Zixiibacteriota bacterium]
MKFPYRVMHIASLHIILVVVMITAASAQTPPSDSASQLLAPSGQIAYIRAGNIWIMDADGTNQRMVCEVHNADGRLSWSPDNRQIVFTRSGVVDLKAPDMTGGRHKVYDLFLCDLDSADTGNMKHWIRLTEQLGARGPEWSGDGAKILLWNDMNADRISAHHPSYQLCLLNVADGEIELLRPDWKQEEELFLVTPTMNDSGDIAFVFFDEYQPGGIVVLSTDEIKISLDSIGTLAAKNMGLVAPRWSPDGAWLAAIGVDSAEAGLYRLSPDLLEKSLIVKAPARTTLAQYPPSFSPDAKWLTFATDDGSIWICDIEGNNLRRLTRPGKDTAPCWSR